MRLNAEVPVPFSLVPSILEQSSPASWASFLYSITVPVPTVPVILEQFSPASWASCSIFYHCSCSSTYLELPYNEGAMNTTIDSGTMITTPEGINAFHLLSIKYALKLECVGLRHSRGSVAKMVREMIGSKTRDKQELLAEYDGWLQTVLPVQR